VRSVLLTILLVMATLPGRAAERWQVLPPTPAPLPSEHSGHVDANGISIYYAIYGQGPPVILLHGGLVNSDWWGNQIPALAAHHTVIVMDSRGHGRSSRDARPYSYDLMADDVVALLDALSCPRPTLSAGVTVRSLALIWHSVTPTASARSLPSVRPP
jgi:pimeloyl-ACP methyl ester carboxylesterase